MLCRAVDATEEEAKKVVEDMTTDEPHSNTYYKAYNEDKAWKFTALESLQTLLIANEIYTENPLGEKPYFDDLSERQSHDYFERLEQWELAQQNVGNWYLMIEPL